MSRPPKIKWRVAARPTGRYRSFGTRSWPSASYLDQPLAYLSSESEYQPSTALTGDHQPLTIRVADWSNAPAWKWRTLKRRAATLQEAKDITAEFFARNPNWLPK